MNPASFKSRFLRRAVLDHRVVVTGGPALAPIDAMRVLTNRSTGELSIRIANALAELGASVDLWLGSMASSPLPVHADVRVARFETNEDLLRCFEDLAPGESRIAAIFHAAALSDFVVSRAERDDGSQILDGKIPSAERDVRLILIPAAKVLPRLRALFPGTYLCGWKFEADEAETARRAAHKQLLTARTDACVLNGPAVGAGFEWHRADGTITRHAERSELAAAIAEAFAEGTCVPLPVR